jgi:hypothetical protein
MLATTVDERLNGTENHMSRPSAVSVLTIGAAVLCLGASISMFATASTGKNELGVLNANEGIIVDPNGFSIVKGVAKTDPTAQIAKLGAKEVVDGAIIFRVGDKLYLADANLARKAAFWDAYERNLP